jgi:peptidoglycan/xylan/chitin deacetylase (PgdA/CDA1 family)
MDPRVNLKIFLFHRVNPAGNAVWPPIHPSHFDRILQHLKKKYEIVPLEKTILKEYIPSSKQLCAITFDDGYRDFIDYAMPILHKHQAPASMYIITDCAEKGLPPWTFLFSHLLMKTKMTSLNIRSEKIGSSFRHITWKSETEKMDLIGRFLPTLKKISDAEKEEIIRQIKAQITDVEEPRGLMMSWDDIRSARNAGIEIGSHSANHPALSNDLSQSNLYNELKRSGEKIQKETSQFPLAISYPFGIYNQEVKKVAREVGYKMGLTVYSGTFTENGDQFEIPRIELYSESFLRTRLRINGKLPWLKNMLFPSRLYQS